MAKPVCAIVGVGPGNGAAFARAFTARGYRTALLARSQTYLKQIASELEDAQGFTYDARDAERAAEVFPRIREQMGPVSVLVYNAGAGRFSNVDETTAEDFESAWRTNALGCLLAAQQVIPDMRTAGGGNIVVIGATASLKGNANFLPFASAKAAQRSLAQSMARHLDPERIHVSYVIIDGVIDLERTRRAMPDKPDEFFLSSEHIAESVCFLTEQPASAWTFELDLRPFREKW